MQRRSLVLADGTVFSGTAFGAPACPEVAASGASYSAKEVVFTTGMTGYQEALTDLSYIDQIVVFTYPLIGNTGINRFDMEAVKPGVSGIICRKLARRPSHWASHLSLAEFAAAHNLPGITGVDTRSLTLHLREAGVMPGVIVDGIPSAAQVEELTGKMFLPQQHLVAAASTHSSYQVPGEGTRVVLVDFGAKQAILRSLSQRGCNVIVVPATTTIEQVRALRPDGVMLSNGPGDPALLTAEIELVRQLQQEFPTFGICLGHQLLCLANGAKTEKLKFGHRGLNHPVRELKTGRVMMTSQNHGYAVAATSLPGTPLEVTHLEINDGTVEGVRHTHLPVMSVQFHPEAAAGPHDGEHLFDDFIALCATQK